MSGGSLNYFYNSLYGHVGDFGDVELDDLVADLAYLFNARELYLSSDTCEGQWREARDKFKEKWFTRVGRKVRIDGYVEKFSRELLDALGFGLYCRDCANWTPEEDTESRYGHCTINSHCLMHRSEYCEKYKQDLRGYEKFKEILSKQARGST